MVTTTGPRVTEWATVTVHGSASGFAQEISVGRHRLVGDEPILVGGTDTGPNPYDLLLAALGSCTSMTVAMYARRKRWPLEAVTVRLRHSKIHAADCEECETKVGRLDQIECDLEFTGALSGGNTFDCWRLRTSAPFIALSPQRFASRSDFVTTVVEPHNDAFLSRSALPMTEIELNVMAALAIIGLSSRPSHG